MADLSKANMRRWIFQNLQKTILTEWINRAEQFFHYQETPEDQKVLLLSSFHCEGEAIQSLQWYEKTQPRLTWPLFTNAFCVPFEPTYEDFDEALSKIRQTGRLQDFQN